MAFGNILKRLDKSMTKIVVKYLLLFYLTI